MNEHHFPLGQADIFLIIASFEYCYLCISDRHKINDIFLGLHRL